MGFFDFLKSNSQDEKSILPNLQTKSFNSIDEILNLNLSELPNDDYEVTEIMDNGFGDKFRNYQNFPNQKICSLFDAIEIKKFIGKPNKNYIFSSYEISNISKLKELTNKLVNIYGIDSQNLGKFTTQDEIDIKDGYWNGRTWLDSEKNKTPLMISYDNENGISMTVFKTEI